MQLYTQISLLLAIVRRVIFFLFNLLLYVVQSGWMKAGKMGENMQEKRRK